MLGKWGMHIQNHQSRYEAMAVIVIGIVTMMGGVAAWFGGFNLGGGVYGYPPGLPVGSHTLLLPVLSVVFGLVLVVGGAIRLRKKE